MSLSRYEQEAIINFNDDEDIAEVYTASPVTMRRMDKLCERFPDTYRCVKRNSGQATYHCPKDRIRFASPTSEAQREAGRRSASNLSRKRTGIPGA